MSRFSAIWLRSETTANEPRTPLVPRDAGTIAREGLPVFVERCPQRVYPDEAYALNGCRLVDRGTWPASPPGAIVVGMKDLPSSDDPISQTHLFFAHAYKAQPGAERLLWRFGRGGGTILDYEYLVDEAGRRLVGTGFWAGFVGAALGVERWAEQRIGVPAGASRPFATSRDIVERVRDVLARCKARPRVALTGPRGRCGKGAKALLESVGIAPEEWARDETAGGPHARLLDFDVLVHCVGTQERHAPLLTRETLALPGRRLSVIADVTCDAGNPFNLLPLYDSPTRFDRPFHRLASAPGLELLALDRLPALLPRECSDEFSAKLLPLLAELLSGGSEAWRRAERYFRHHLERLEANDRSPLERRRW